MIRFVRNASRRCLSPTSTKHDVAKHYDAKDLRRNRKQISNYIKRIGKEANVDLALDSRGYCCIPFKKFFVLVQIPEDNPRCVFFYTKVLDMRLSRNPNKVYSRALSARKHGVTFGKYGSVPRVERDEVTLSMNYPISDLDFDKMVECLDDFMQASLMINKALTAIM